MCFRGSSRRNRRAGSAGVEFRPGFQRTPELYCTPMPAVAQFGVFSLFFFEDGQPAGNALGHLPPRTSALVQTAIFLVGLRDSRKGKEDRVLLSLPANIKTSKSLFRAR